MTWLSIWISGSRTILLSLHSDITNTTTFVLLAIYCDSSGSQYANEWDVILYSVKCSKEQDSKSSTRSKVVAKKKLKENKLFGK